MRLRRAFRHNGVFSAAFESLANSVRSFLSVANRFAFPPEWSGKHWLARSVEAISLLAIPFILTMFPLYAAARRVPVYEEFVEGAKEGFQVAIRILPFLVAILVAVGMFRAAGGVDLLARVLSPISSLCGSRRNSCRSCSCDHLAGAAQMASSPNW